MFWDFIFPCYLGATYLAPLNRFSGSSDVNTYIRNQPNVTHLFIMALKIEFIYQS